MKKTILILVICLIINGIKAQQYSGYYQQNGNPDNVVNTAISNKENGTTLLKIDTYNSSSLGNNYLVFTFIDANNLTPISNSMKYETTLPSESVSINDIKFDTQNSCYVACGYETQLGIKGSLLMLIDIAGNVTMKKCGSQFNNNNFGSYEYRRVEVIESNTNTDVKYIVCGYGYNNPQSTAYQGNIDFYDNSGNMINRYLFAPIGYQENSKYMDLVFNGSNKNIATIGTCYDQNNYPIGQFSELFDLSTGIVQSLSCNVDWSNPGLEISSIEFDLNYNNNDPYFIVGSTNKCNIYCRKTDPFLNTIFPLSKTYSSPAISGLITSNPYFTSLTVTDICYNKNTKGIGITGYCNTNTIPNSTPVFEGFVIDLDNALNYIDPNNSWTIFSGYQTPNLLPFNDAGFQHIIYNSSSTFLSSPNYTYILNGKPLNPDQNYSYISEYYPGPTTNNCNALNIPYDLPGVLFDQYHHIASLSYNKFNNIFDHFLFSPLTINLTSPCGSPQSVDIPQTPTITVVDNCGSSTLTATGYTGSLIWSNNATTSSITVTNAGPYTVSQIINGFTSNPANGIANPYPIPPAPIIVGTGRCDGASILQASNYTYALLWSTGATTSSITTTTAGTYTVTQTDGHGCTATGHIIVSTMNIFPLPLIDNHNNCDGTSTLTVTNYPNATFLWNTGDITPSITVSTNSVFSVTVNGCSLLTKSVTANPSFAPPIPIISGTGRCDGASILQASNYNYALLWNTGATTSSITTTTTGTYTVTQTDGRGCTATGHIIVSAMNILPLPLIDNHNNCDGTSTLTINNYSLYPTGTNFLWSNGATTSSIMVSTSNMYSVTANGCSLLTSSVTATPTLAPHAPIIIGTGRCDGASILEATNYIGSLLWSTGVTTSSITVSMAGTYSVTQTDVNGCTSTGQIIISSMNIFPQPTIDIHNNCDNTATLQVNNYPLSSTYYLWNTGDITHSITVSTNGLFSVTINGCSLLTKSVTVDPSIPIAPAISSSAPLCDNSLNLTASNYTGTLKWYSNSVATTQTAATIRVVNTNTYSVTQTIYGCESLKSNSIPGPTNYIPPPTVTVTNNWGKSDLVATFYSGATYLWSNGATTRAINVTSPGTYYVTVNNCFYRTSSGVAAPLVPATPVVTANEFCDGHTRLYITGNWSPGAVLHWKLNGSPSWQLQNSNYIDVTIAGWYSVSQEVSGASSAFSTPVYAICQSKPSQPSINYSTYCSGNTIIYYTLYPANYSGTVNWSAVNPSSIFYPIPPNYIEVHSNDVYILSQTVNGCTSDNALMPISDINVSGQCHTKSIDQIIDNVNRSNNIIEVYPNPAKDELSIQFDNVIEGTAIIELFDLTGKLIYNTSINTDLKLQTLNISSLKAGMYNLRISGNNITKNQKLVIIK